MALELSNLALHLHGQPLLGPLSLRVAAGEVCVVMGASGSGKSSLLAHVAGLLQPPLSASGQVLLHGQALEGMPTEQRRVGLLFQDDLLFPHLSVLDNLLFALPARNKRSERMATCEAALDRAGLAGFAQRLPSTLSGGQRARVSLLRALLAEPRALLLDEPFSKLDTALRASMRSFVWQELARQQVCALLVTHDAQDIPPGASVIQLTPHQDSQP